jgi:transposase
VATPNSPFQRRYPPELRERAVRMVHETIAASGERIGAVTELPASSGLGLNPCAIGSHRPTLTMASAPVSRRTTAADHGRGAECPLGGGPSRSNRIACLRW